MNAQSELGLTTTRCLVCLIEVPVLIKNPKNQPSSKSLRLYKAWLSPIVRTNNWALTVRAWRNNEPRIELKRVQNKCTSINSPFKNEIPSADDLVKRICDRSLFYKHWHETFIFSVKIPYKLHFNNDHNLFRIGKVTAIQSYGEKLFLQRGSNLRPFIPRWQTTTLTAFFQLSLRPGKVAAWYDHTKSRPVWSSHHFMIRCDHVT